MTFETKVFTTMGILGFVGAIICLSPNMTGNAIGELSGKSTNLLGMIFLAIGIASIWITKIED